jgi:hypothetical protein
MRFQTYFGVPVPPWKEELLGAGAATIRFVVLGSIPSKKNNQMAVTVKKNARAWIRRQSKDGKIVTLNDALYAIDLCHSKMRGNAKYAAFLEEQKPLILQQAAGWSERLSHKGLVFPIQRATMNLRLYFSKRYVTDTVNKQQSIQDLLVDCGILANDDYRTLNPISSASACYVDEIVNDIAFISLSFKLKEE